ncbi:MAG: hypothetical protein MK201_06575 [Gammaproteobacteria bacterium]|nr:hypothetical protein [Gammaproteobacteria bacterium]
MADPISYLRLLEEGEQIDYLLKSPDVTDEEKEELEYIWNSLKSRKESKFDAIIGVIKECDKYMDQLETEMKEIKNNYDHWKKKRSNVINIIKMAYEKQLISSKPTGTKYQATIRPTKTKLIDNFDKWTRNEKENFGLYKRTVITRAIDNSIINQKQEELPDKERIRKVLTEHPKEAPATARLVQRVSLVYGLRKRIKKGV